METGNLLFLALLSLYENILFNSYLTLYDENFLKKYSNMPWFVTWNVYEIENFERKRDYTKFIFCDNGNILSLSFVLNIISGFVLSGSFFNAMIWRDQITILLLLLFPFYLTAFIVILRGRLIDECFMIILL